MHTNPIAKNITVAAENADAIVGIITNNLPKMNAGRNKNYGSKNFAVRLVSGAQAELANKNRFLICGKMTNS